MYLLLLSAPPASKESPIISSSTLQGRKLRHKCRSLLAAQERLQGCGLNRSVFPFSATQAMAAKLGRPKDHTGSPYRECQVERQHHSAVGLGVLGKATGPGGEDGSQCGATMVQFWNPSLCFLQMCSPQPATLSSFNEDKAFLVTMTSKMTTQTPLQSNP